MKRKLTSWFARKAEEEFPVRKPERIGLFDRVKVILVVTAGCILGLLLVAFGISAISGRWDMFFFLSGLMVAGGLGTVIATVLVLLVMNVAANWIRGNMASPFSAEASDSIRLACAADEAFRRCRAALRQLPQDCELRPEESSPGEILAKTGMSWKSAGESISLRLTALGDDTTEVAVRSVSWVDSTLFDWGINAENVRTITRHLGRATLCGAASD